MSQPVDLQFDSLRGRALLFECGDWVIALPALYIERVGFAHELSIRPFDTEVSDQSTSLVGMTEGEGWARPTWDMGVLLGQDEQFESYSLVTVPTRNGKYSATLLGGRVLTFESVPRKILSDVPESLFQSRTRCVRAEFPVPRVLPNYSAGDGRPGLWIDLRRMWSASDVALHEKHLAKAST